MEAEKRIAEVELLIVRLEECRTEAAAAGANTVAETAAVLIAFAKTLIHGYKLWIRAERAREVAEFTFPD